MAALAKEYTRYRKYFFDIVSLYRKRQDLRMFLEILLSLGAISFFGLFAIRPTFITVSELIAQIQTKEETLAAMETKVQNLNTAQSIYQQEFAKIEVLGKAIPQSPSPETYVRQVEGLANRSGVSLLGLTVGETTLVGEEGAEKDADLVELPQGAEGMIVNITAAGEYQNLTSFLQSLENLRRPIWTDLMSFNLVESGEGDRLTLSITGRAVYLQENQTNNSSQ